MNLPLRVCLAVALAAIAPVLRAAETTPPPHVFMVGDSTMANKPLDLPERGWGMLLPEFLREPGMVQNHAMNGRSTKSFIDEGRWDKVVAELKAGDFVIIQFGHNDEKDKDPKRYTDPATTFRDNLRRFVRDTRAKGATPILATPVCRRKFDANGKLVDTHGAWPDATRAVAAEEKVPLLELQHATAAWLQSVGNEPSRQFFMWIEPGKYPKIPDGRKDDTHFVEAGARHVAGLAAAEIRLNLPLARWLK
ncbi:rhamnogalacturonan acetylesterase [Opitutus sp. ER46]|uniref:rhamnogalacturonan acetylesterase n=1 Tax=Opitutus sp. ER46 TaxID=2161864 RepID=UPI001304D65C|nr:rhamnogalacturonan acetylesterase [Opitutus sp. ER46]